MVGHGAKFDRKKDDAIIALLQYGSVEQAAVAIGIGTNTLWRWLKEPEFDRAYREAQRAAYSQSLARLQQASSAAVTTVLKIMLDPNAKTANRLRAAEIVLDRAADGLVLEDIQVRVTALERGPRAKISRKPERITMAGRSILPAPAKAPLQITAPAPKLISGPKQ